MLFYSLLYAYYKNTENVFNNRLTNIKSLLAKNRNYRTILIKGSKMVFFNKQILS